MNSIAMYVLVHLEGRFFGDSFKINFWWLVRPLGEEWGTFLCAFVALAVEWLILRWMYKRRIFLKL